MLFSLLLTLTPTTPTQLNGFYGREAQAWFLGQLAHHAPEMAEALHGYSGAKPYTVSSLIVPDAGRRSEHGAISLIPGNECHLRITSLVEPLTGIILEQLLPNLP